MRAKSSRKNPAQLAVALYCHGLRLTQSCTTGEDARPLAQRRAGLGSGLELVIPGDHKSIWVNVPIVEAFVQTSPYLLVKAGNNYAVVCADGPSWPVTLPPTPDWYNRKTSSGKLMSRIGVLQGTYLGIYIGQRCAFWNMTPRQACQFCATGINVGVHEESEKSVADVIETALAAKRESGVTFVHLNSGYQEGNDIVQLMPFVKALKTEVGTLVGLQFIPPQDPRDYAPLLKLDVDHFSICYELHSPEAFARYLPGKTAHIGQERFFRALEFLAQRLPRGSVSGEIIAGLEPIASTLAAIEYITDRGAFPTVCIFRPLQGSPLEQQPSPSEAEMTQVLCQVASACRRKKIPVGLAPNLEVSLVMTPDDARFLLPRDFAWYAWHYRLAVLKALARPYFALKSSRWFARCRQRLSR